MKKSTGFLLLALAMTAVFAVSAQAHCGACGAYASEAVSKAKTGVHAVAKADMGKCCVAAVQAGKGCCGKDAEGLKTSFQEKVSEKS